MADSLLSQLKTDNGTSIDVGDLTALVAGLLASALSSGYAAWIDAVLSTFVINPARGLAKWLSEFVGAVIGVPADVLSASWGETARFVGNFGIVALPVAAVVVIVLAYIVAEGWSLRG